MRWSRRATERHAHSGEPELATSELTPGPVSRADQDQSSPQVTLTASLWPRHPSSVTGSSRSPSSRDERWCAENGVGPGSCGPGMRRWGFGSLPSEPVRNGRSTRCDGVRQRRSQLAGPTPLPRMIRPPRVQRDLPPASRSEAADHATGGCVGRSRSGERRLRDPLRGLRRNDLGCPSTGTSLRVPNAGPVGGAEVAVAAPARRSVLATDVDASASQIHSERWWWSGPRRPPTSGHQSNLASDPRRSWVRPGSRRAEHRVSTARPHPTPMSCRPVRISVGV
jgi:hypothetical protein